MKRVSSTLHALSLLALSLVVLISCTGGQQPAETPSETAGEGQNEVFGDDFESGETESWGEGEAPEAEDQQQTDEPGAEDPDQAGSGPAAPAEGAAD